MKKFVTAVPLQPIERDKSTGVIIKDNLKKNIYEPIGNEKLKYDKETRFPIIPVINGFVEPNEEIRVIAIQMDTESSREHTRQLREELNALKQEKQFLFEDLEVVEIEYRSDVEAQIELFSKLLGYFEDGDRIYGCLTYGVKPVPIAELMSIQYAYRVLNDTSIECLVYGDNNHDRQNPKYYIYDITSLIILDEIVRILADKKVKNPRAFIDTVIKMRKENE